MRVITECGHFPWNLCPHTSREGICLGIRWLYTVCWIFGENSVIFSPRYPFFYRQLVCIHLGHFLKDATFIRTPYHLSKSFASLYFSLWYSLMKKIEIISDTWNDFKSLKKFSKWLPRIKNDWRSLWKIWKGESENAWPYEIWKLSILINMGTFRKSAVFQKLFGPLHIHLWTIFLIIFIIFTCQIFSRVLTW